MIEKVFPKEYFKERRLFGLSVAMLIVTLITVLRVLLQVKQYDYKVTVRYTQYGADSFELGEWYTLYEPALFAIVTTVVALLISFRLFHVDKSLSYVVVTLQLVALGYLFVVAGALLGASSIAT
jgi:hypothetical protein